jgi:MFS family permease
MSLAVCCALLAVVPSIPAGAAIVVLVVAVVALTLGELTQSAGGWGLSYALAPESRRGIYLSTFEAGVTAQQVFGPGLLLAVLIPVGMWGWLALGISVLAAGAAVVPATRQGGRLPHRARRSVAERAAPRWPRARRALTSTEPLVDSE